LKTLITSQERLKQEQASMQVISQNAQKDHEFSFDGLNLDIYKEVFSPRYFNGWRTFTPKLRELIKKGEEFLEIGVGSGITSLLLAKDGVNVTATDISPSAVEDTKFNAKKNNIVLQDVFISDVYDGFCSHKKFDAIYWNAPWMETIASEKINDVLEYGLFDNGFKNIERWISQSKYYLKPHGRIYIGHADFGDYKRLEKLLETYGFEYKVVASDPSTEILDVEFYMYEAKLAEKPNKIFIAMPFSGSTFEEVIRQREAYYKQAAKYDLELLEQFIGQEEKEKFENALYDPEFIVKKDIALIDQAQILLVDLHRISVGAAFEVSYAKLKREIPVIGFGCQNDINKRHPWLNHYCDRIADTIDEALDFANQYCQ
jgi:release factor glutamine methyltransferase